MQIKAAAQPTADDSHVRSCFKGERVMTSIKRTAAAFAIAAATIGGAFAQDRPPQQGPWGPGGMMGWGYGPGMMGGYGPGTMGWGGPGSWGWRGSGQAFCDTVADHVDGRLGYLKAELKITDAQEALWKSYAAAAREGANTMVARCTAMMNRTGASLNLPDRLDQNEQLTAAQLDAVRAINKALKPLYAALSDTQKQTADQLFWGPMGIM
jgi:LTXXQ motif family protein